MRKFFVFLLSLALFTGCYKNAKKPKTFLNQDKMVNVLSDLYIHQQSTYLTESKLHNTDLGELDVQILNEHGVTPEVFKENYRYYFLQPEKYKKLMIGVRTNLENMLPEAERQRRINEREGEAEAGPGEFQ